MSVAEQTKTIRQIYQPNLFLAEIRANVDWLVSWLVFNTFRRKSERSFTEEKSIRVEPVTHSIPLFIIYIFCIIYNLLIICVLFSNS